MGLKALEEKLTAIERHVDEIRALASGAPELDHEEIQTIHRLIADLGHYSDLVRQDFNRWLEDRYYD